MNAFDASRLTDTDIDPKVVLEGLIFELREETTQGDDAADAGAEWAVASPQQLLACALSAAVGARAVVVARDAAAGSSSEAVMTGIDPSPFLHLPSFISFLFLITLGSFSLSFPFIPLGLFVFP
jgi:hypothetical protein